jgi:type I restriction enzyme S subunit
LENKRSAFYRAREIVKLAQQGFVDNELFISEDMFRQYSTKYGIPVAGDIMVTGVGTLGICYVVQKPHKFYFKDGNIIWLKKKSEADSRFIEYAFKSDFLRKQIDDSVGATVGTYTIVKAKNTKIPVPPLPEQQRIVGILDEAFEGIATAKGNAEKNLQNARALFESHLQSIFTQRGKGWADRQLASLCDEITVGHVGPMKTEYKESGVPFLRSQNIRPFEVSMDNAMFIDEAFHCALKKSQLRPGDLAIVRTGYPGTAAVIPPALHDSNCSDLVIVRPSKEVNPHFLAAFFNSAFGKQLVLGKIVGAAQKHFNITAAKEVMLHVPPMTEQRAVVAKLDDLRVETQRLESIYERKLAALGALKKSLLHQAFSGQL